MIVDGVNGNRWSERKQDIDVTGNSCGMKICIIIINIQKIIDLETSSSKYQQRYSL